ncbi:12823_t:CDS:2 [Funneliformis geosporum]|uniref:12713_t:CDS:1 n=1 Tax=Funneliformis geosporum TaxID=1117311 RepID=A0A9W4SAW0_9GLOM|nr:12713_t:CDS:2 [Funneliformis geosporum]CAI2162284.1 12823_t:CDS:2 [Funneliformis geosporum]
MTELFSPEILSEIFKFLYVSDHQKSNLFNCVIVNRFWCRTAIPVLWSDPFRFFDYEIPDGLITIYIACLTKRERRSLKRKGIEVPMKVKSPSFDYITFLKNLNYYGLISSLFHFGCNGIYKKNDSFDIMLPALLEILANRDLILQSLELENHDRRGDWDNEYMHLVNPNVRSLVEPVKKLYLDCKVLNAKFLPLLNGECQSVRHLHINLHFQNSKKENIICERDVTYYADLIERQESLEVLMITNFVRCFKKIFPSFKKQAKSLRVIEFINSDFKECESLEEIANCENLQCLIFRKCDNLTDEIFRPLFNANLPKLQQVSLEHSKRDKEIEIWLQSFMQERN